MRCTLSAESVFAPDNGPSGYTVCSAHWERLRAGARYRIEDGYLAVGDDLPALFERYTWRFRKEEQVMEISFHASDAESVTVTLPRPVAAELAHSLGRLGLGPQ